MDKRSITQKKPDASLLIPASPKSNTINKNRDRDTAPNTTFGGRGDSSAPNNPARIYYNLFSRSQEEVSSPTMCSSGHDSISDFAFRDGGEHRTGDGAVGRRKKKGILLTHGKVAELNEGFRMVSDKDRQHITIDTLQKAMESTLIQNSEGGMKDISDALKAVAQTFCCTNSVNFPEFLALILKGIDSDEIREMITAFHYYDKKKTGKVTSAQFCTMMATMGEKSNPEEVEEMMKFADPEETGLIDYMQFIEKLCLPLQSKYGGEE